MKTTPNLNVTISSSTPFEIARLDKFLHALSGGPAVHLKDVLTEKVGLSDIRKYLSEQGFRELAIGANYVDFTKDDLVGDYKDYSSSFTLAGTNEERVEALAHNLKERFGKQVTPRNSIYVLTEGREEYGIERLCQAAPDDLIEDNYSPKVVRAFQRLRSEMLAKKPHGRLGILTGHPGTGKTFLARALMGPYVENADFILMNPEEVQGLARNPSKFLRLRARREGQIPILILEDADQAVKPREDKTVSIIQKILNFGDGILGDAYNLRILLTSNVRTPEIDPAVLRPGRLIEHIEVGALSTPHAKKVYQRLTGRERTYTNPVTLATVYQHSVQDPMSVAAE